MTLRRKIIVDTIRLNASGLIVQALGMLQSILLIKFLEPSSLGRWLAALLVLNYAAYASMGLEHGMGLRLPYYRGRGEPMKTAVASDTAYVTWTSLSVAFAIVVAITTLLRQGDALSRVALLGVAAIIPLVQQQAFYGRWQTTVPIDFATGTRIAVIQGITTFGLVVPLAYAFGVHGVIAGTIVANVVAVLLWRMRSSYRFGHHTSRETLREMVHAGFPTMLVVLGGLLMQTVDKLVIVGALGATSLGYYAVTGLGGNALYGLLSQAGSAMAPHLVEHSGRNVRDPSQLAKYLVRPTLMFGYASAALLVIVGAAIPALVRLLVPKYLPGLPAFYAFVPGFFFLAVILTASNILLLIMIERSRTRVPLYLQISAILVQLGLALLAVRLGLGLVGIALASTLSYAVYGMGTLHLVSHHVLPAHDRRAFLGAVLVPFVVGIVGAAALFALTASILSQHVVLRSMVDIAGAALLAIVLLGMGVRRAGLGAEVAPLLAWARTRVLPASNRV